MRRSLLLALAVVAALTTASAAQVPGSPFGSCDRCFLVSWVDVPADAASPTASRSAGFIAAGWGFVCEGGAPADRIDVFYQKDDGYFTPLRQPGGATFYALERPDVAAAYAPYCPRVNDYTGWHLWVTNMPPVGTRQVMFVVWRGPHKEIHYRTLSIVE